MQLTEHYWLINELLPEYKSKTITEYFPTDVLKWQGIIPEEAADRLMDGDEAEAQDAAPKAIRSFCFYPHLL